MIQQTLTVAEAIATCQMSAPVLYYVIEGQGSLRVGDEEVRLRAGSLALAPAGATRSIAADARMRVLAVQMR